MVQHVDTGEFLAFAIQSPIIDVRSPAEFGEGHIPAAVNLPLFDDAERAAIGSTYAEQGREPAVLTGLDIVGPKLRQYVERTREIVPYGRQPLLHCWRGGMRSTSVAWLLEQAGWCPIVLNGGYKAYRRHTRRMFAQPLRLVVLSGMTGAGKTERLCQLSTCGEQVIDLEELAHHRGSAFGGIGKPPQPTTQQFENELARRLAMFDITRRIWVEDECRAIGRVRVPDEFWDQMRAAAKIFIDVPRGERLQRSASEYGTMPLTELAAAVTRVQRRLGGQLVKETLAALERGDRDTAAKIMLDYYDRSYSHSLGKRTGSAVLIVSLCASESTEPLLKIADQLEASQPFLADRSDTTVPQ